MGAILPPLFHLHEGDPTGVGLPLIAAVLAVNPVFRHGSERGSTIDAIGDGKYLVCNPAYCFMVHGLRQAHEAVQRQEQPAL